jgi:hypothetical protein
MEEAPKKKRTHFRDNHPAPSEYDEWWSNIHVLRCDAEDFAAGRTHSFYTKNSLSRGPLLNRALRTIARGLWLLRSGFVHNNSHWEHLMVRALQSYVTVRDKRWRFTVRDPTKEEANEIMELAEKTLAQEGVSGRITRECESRWRTEPLVQEAGKEVRGE